MNLQLKKHCGVFIARLNTCYQVIYPNRREWVIDSPENSLTQAHLKAERCIEALRFNAKCRDSKVAVYTLNIADNLTAPLLNGLHSGKGTWQNHFDRISTVLDKYQHVLITTLSSATNSEQPYLSVIEFNPHTSEQTTHTFILNTRQPRLQIQARQDINQDRAVMRIENKVHPAHRQTRYQNYFSLLTHDQNSSEQNQPGSTDFSDTSPGH